MAEKETEIKQEAASEPAEAEKEAGEKKATAKVDKKATGEAKEKAAPKAAKKESKVDVEGMIDSIKNMTVLELSQLVKALETEFGVSAAAPVLSLIHI